MQQLILPVDNCGVMCGFKNEKYKEYWGYSHWGVDYYDSNLTLKSMGNGTVLLSGYDNVFGNIIIIEYDDVYNHYENKTLNVVCRMYHMAKASTLKSGDKVSVGDVIGTMGTTGKYSSGVHVHVEFDSDTQYYNYGGPLASSSNLIKKGYDNTLIDPSHLLYKGENQTIFNKGYVGWVEDYEINLPLLKRTNYEEEYKKLLNDYNNLMDELGELKAKNNDYYNLLVQINDLTREVV